MRRVERIDGIDEILRGTEAERGGGAAHGNDRSPRQRGDPLPGGPVVIIESRRRPRIDAAVEHRERPRY